MDQAIRRLLNKSQKEIKTLKEITKSDVSKKFNITFLLDELDGAQFSGNKLTTSGTPTVDELEAAVGALANRINLIIRALKAEGIIR